MSRSSRERQIVRKRGYKDGLRPGPAILFFRRCATAATARGLQRKRAPNMLFRTALWTDGITRGLHQFVCPRCVHAKQENQRSSEHRQGLCGKAHTIPQQGGDTYDDETFAGNGPRNGKTSPNSRSAHSRLHPARSYPSSLAAPAPDGHPACPLLLAWA